MDVALDPAPPPSPAASDQARQVRAALPSILSLAPRIVAAWCGEAGVAPGGPLGSVAWLAGPVALIAQLRRFAELLEAGPSRPLFTARDLRGRLGGRVVAELRGRTFAERSLYRDAPVSLVFNASSPLDVLAAPARAPEITVEVRDDETAAVLAPLADAGVLRFARIWAIPPGGVALILPALYAKDELVFIARRLAAQIVARRAFKLPGPSVVIVASYWPQRARFLEALNRALAVVPLPILEGMRLEERARAWLGEASGPPFSSIEGVHLEGIGPEDAVEFLAEAVERANVLGADAVEIVAHVVQEEDPLIGSALERAVADLRASSVGINEWPAMAAVRGTFEHLLHPLFDKTLVRGPEDPPRRQGDLLDAETVAERGARLAAFQAAPSLLGLRPRLVTAHV